MQWITNDYQKMNKKFSNLLIVLFFEEKKIFCEFHLMLDILNLLYCLYCAPKESLELFPLQTTEDKEGVRVNQGCLYCTSCTRFYIIKDEILYLSQDNLREKEEELDFLQ